MLNKSQRGFTLIELMISISLGLLIVAAAVMLFISGQRSTVLQSGMGELQQNANFGLATLAHDIRHANLNMVSKQKINRQIVGSGIIFGVQNLPSSLKNVDAALFTQQATGASATTAASDQLTIQYMPEYHQTTIKGKNAADQEIDIQQYTFDGVDCEGNALTFDAPATIVQRYYVKATTNSKGQPVQPAEYNLYCDAGYYQHNDTVIRGMSTSTDGQILMQKVDVMKFRFWVKSPQNTMRYMTFNEYETVMASSAVKAEDATTHYNIYGIELGLIARSSTPMSGEQFLKDQPRFNVVGNAVTLTAGNHTPKYLREVFSQFIAFRNTLGASS